MSPPGPPLALYRRYRPETFADVVGQEHVTQPLRQALRSGRVHHAYLFSGPRGCGKTTSARILARCLNCAQGPTPDPCGTCESCLALARGGPGSIDVIEIDAASHGGVDDARELRDKAFFAPAASRFKVYIIDEAHMVSKEGFNALLKIVEEPPPHVKFVFATTEPEKVLATIRSRTHHYPFRLLPPVRLQEYLGWVCEQEEVPVERGVLPLVVRAGRGSARDALSVLDQLIAGAGPDGVSYPLAVGLLGFTDAALLDESIEALSRHDGGALFRVVEQVIEVGSDPRRFAEDLLERVRDLIVLAAVPDGADTILGEVPADQLERMRQQAAGFGAAELSRAGDILSAGLTEMRGATTPRLHLELMCARLLLPAAYDDSQSVLARLERVERRLAVGRDAAGSVGGGTGSSTPGAAGAGPSPTTQAPPVGDKAPAASGESATAATAGLTGTAARAGSARGSVSSDVILAGDNDGHDDDATSAGDLSAVRALWTDVLARLAQRKRVAWTLVSQNAKVLDLDGGRLVLGFTTASLRDRFTGRDDFQEHLRQSLIDVLGLDCRIEAIVDPSSAAAATATPAPAAPTPPGTSPQPTGPQPLRAGPERRERGGSTAADAAQTASPAPEAGAQRAADRRARAQRPAADGGVQHRSKTSGAPGPGSRATGTGSPVVAAEASPRIRPDEDEVSEDDEVLDELSGSELLRRELGATVIEEYGDAP